MREYDYRKINAFTSVGSLGNPAACIYLKEGEELSKQDMLEVAKQHKGYVSEVVYCKETKTRELKLTYYSSECEVDFCGHGTIACMYSLIKDVPELMKQKEFQVQTNRKGRITVYNKIAEKDAIYITAPDPIYMDSKVTPEMISEYLGIPIESISTKHPISRINGGLITLIVPISSLFVEIEMYPDREKLENFCLENEIDIILVYCKDTKSPDYYAHTRVFAPKFGYLEDPATGSGNSAFGYFLLKNQMWQGVPIAIEQGGKDITYNTIKLYAVDNKVMFGGAAMDCVVGKYYLK